ncbi:MAG: hypothetical protein WAV55_12435 [Clostridiaceae bacterium]
MDGFDDPDHLVVSAYSFDSPHRIDLVRLVNPNKEVPKTLNTK